MDGVEGSGQVAALAGTAAVRGGTGGGVPQRRFQLVRSARLRPGVMHRYQSCGSKAVARLIPDGYADAKRKDGVL